MAQRAVLSSDTTSTDDPKLVLIQSLISQLSLAVVDYLGDYSKNTAGKKSTGDYSFEFVKECFQGMVDFPELLAATFNKEDFTSKSGALARFFSIRAAITEAIDKKWATNLMICKTDSLNYANEFYGIVQREAAKSLKYQPLLIKLKAYYKKTKSDDGNSTVAAKPSAT